MNKEEIFERIKVCEKCEIDYRKANMLDRAYTFNYEKIKWGKILSKLEKVDCYEQALIDIRKIFTECKTLMPHEFDWEEQVDNVLQIIDKSLGDEKVD